MNSFIGTFSVRSPYGDHYQPIVANTERGAIKAMVQVHGDEWLNIHPVDEFLRLRKAGEYPNTRPLEWIGEVTA